MLQRLSCNQCGNWLHAFGTSCACEELRDAIRYDIQKIKKVGPRQFCGHLLKHKFNYFRVHVFYFCLVSIFGGLLIYGIEGTNDATDVSFADGLFTAVSAVCVTGLTSAQFADFDLSSQLIVFFLILGGGTITVNIVVLFVRRYFYRRLYADPQFKQAHDSVDVNSNLEYLALGKLMRITMAYHFLTQFISFIVLGIYGSSASIMEPVFADDGSASHRPINPWFAGAFHSVSAFQNAGFTLMADNFIPLITVGDSFYLIIISFLIVMGNVGAPICLRTVIKICSRFDSDPPEIYEYILTESRRCSLHLFPERETRLLITVFLALNFSEFLFFIILDRNSPVIEVHPWNIRLLIGYFQAISTRTAGFNCIDLSQLSSAMNVLDLAMMYISAYPMFLTLQHSAVSNSEKAEASSSSHSSASSSKPTGFSTPKIVAINQTESNILDTPFSLSAGPGSIRDSPDIAVPQGRPLPSLELTGSTSPRQSSLDDSSIPTSSIPTGPEIARFHSAVELGKDSNGQRRATDSNAYGPRLRRIHTTGDDIGGRDAARSLPLHPRDEYLTAKIRAKRRRMTRKVGFIRSQFRTLLLRDIFWIYCGLFVISAIEYSYGRDDLDVSVPSEQNHLFANVFRTMFELISAYGTVGLSLGTPGLPSGVSYSYSLQSTSKLIVIFIMLLGRHRNMPDSLDAAVEVHTISKHKHFQPRQTGNTNNPPIVEVQVEEYETTLTQRAARALASAIGIQLTSATESVRARARLPLHVVDVERAPSTHDLEAPAQHRHGPPAVELMQLFEEPPVRATPSRTHSQRQLSINAGKPWRSPSHDQRVLEQSQTTPAIVVVPAADSDAIPAHMSMTALQTLTATSSQSMNSPGGNNSPRAQDV